jgi:hypothetical protein
MTNVAEKLRIRSGAVVRLINAPPNAADLLGPLPPDARLTGERVEADAVILFAQDRQTLMAHLGDAVHAASGDRLLWVAYPKGGSGVATDINRDKVAALVIDEGVTVVSQVALDSTWSALRARASERYQAGGKADR